MNPAFEQYVKDKESGRLAEDPGLTGYVPSPTLAPETTQLQPMLSLAGALPYRYDLREEGRVTPVKNQSPHGTCWAFAGLGSLESCLLTSAGETEDFSEDHLVLTSGFDDDPFIDGPYFEGNNPKVTAYLARWGGPVYESDDPYGDGTSPPGLSARKHVQEVLWLPNRTSSIDNDVIKQAVIDYGGVSASMYYSGTYWNDATDSYYCSSAFGPNHGVLIVGWSDYYPASNFSAAPPGDGAFIVKNSYGTSWGDGGYFYVSYYDAVLARSEDLGALAVFDGVESTTNYHHVYQHDPLGQTGYVNGPAWFANKFVGTETELLTAVGFYTLVPDTDYHVYVGPSLDDLSELASGSVSDAGYHTVALSTPSVVVDGEEFVVAVKIDSVNGEYIAVERPFDNYSSGATASAGQSYYGYNGTYWADMTGYIANTNVCLKAFTSELPDIKTNELMFYRSSDGQRVVLDVNASGGTALLNKGSWSTGWSYVIPMELDGDSRSEMLVYNKYTGKRVFLDFSASGHPSTISVGTTITGWTQIVPVEVDGDAADELLFYRSSDGKRVLVEVGSDGAISTISSGTWSAGWSHIVPLELDGDARSELLVYNKVTGRRVFLDLSSSGYPQALSPAATWSTNWSQIMPVSVDGDTRDELMFYRSSDGLRVVLDVNSGGYTTLVSKGTWSAGWTHVTPVELDWDTKSELLVYNKNTGRRVFLDLAPGGYPSALSIGTWSKNWSHIVPIEVDGT